MAMCISGECLIKAGSGVSEVLSGGQLYHGVYPIQLWISGAEAEINCFCRNNFSNTYASLDNDKKYIINSIASDLVAINMVCFDMGGYTSRVEAEDIINVRRDSAQRGLSILRDKKTQDFINAA